MFKLNALEVFLVFMLGLFVVIHINTVISNHGLATKIHELDRFVIDNHYLKD